MLFVFVSLGFEHGLDLLWWALPLIAVFSPICLCTTLLSCYQLFYSYNINTMPHPSFLTWGLSMQCFVVRTRGCLHRGLWSHPLVLVNYVIGHWTCHDISSDYIKKKHKSDHGTDKVFEMTIFRPTWSLVMVQSVLQWERQKRLCRCKY